MLDFTNWDQVKLERIKQVIDRIIIEKSLELKNSIPETGQRHHLVKEVEEWEAIQFGIEHEILKRDRKDTTG